MAINLERIANELNVNLEDLDLVAAAEHDLTDIYNVGPKRKQSFKEAGVQNIIIVATMPVEEIMRIAEVSESQAEIIQASARQLMLQT
jgi:predicted flap endonuclease-1-like 5' DNA nuclease